jgi:hypothetical protein
MKTITKAAFGALALAALGAGASSPANAAASFGFSFGPEPYYRGAYYATDVSGRIDSGPLIVTGPVLPIDTAIMADRIPGAPITVTVPITVTGIFVTGTGAAED